MKEQEAGNALIVWMEERLEEKKGLTDPEALAIMSSLVTKLKDATPEAKADLTEDGFECMVGAIVAYMDDL